LVLCFSTAEVTPCGSSARTDTVTDCAGEGVTGPWRRSENVGPMFDW
jgi:hypothetical protein